MTRKQLFILFGGVFLLVLLATHRSGRPEILSRYSLSYFAFLVFYLLCVVSAALLFTTRLGKYVRLREALQTLSEIQLNVFVVTHFSRLIFAAFLLHFFLVLLFIPPQAVFSNSPILETDYAFHFHQVSSVVEALSTTGRHWAYDPSFCAGYPLGTLFDVDMKLIELVTFLLTRLGLSTAFAFNLIILSFFLLVPILLFYTSRNFGFGAGTSFLIVLSGILLWHSHRMLLMFNFSGMCSFIFGIYWTLLAASLFYRFLTGGGWRVYVLFLIFLSVGLSIHVLMPFLLAVPLVSLYWRKFRHISPGRHLLAVLAVLAAVITNSWWITTLFRFLPYRVETAFFSSPSLKELLQSIFTLNDPDLLFGVLGIWGFYCIRSQNRTVGTMGLLSVLWYFLLGYTMENVPLLGSLEPARFRIPLVVFSMIGVFSGASVVYGSFHKPLTELRKLFPAVLALLFLLGNFLIPKSFFENRFENKAKELSRLTEWITSNTTRDARIAFMDQSPGFLAGAKMQFYTKRDFIGGPFSQMNLKHSRASFTRDRFITRRLADLTEADITKFTDRYNINWLITTTDEGSGIFGGFSPLLNPVDKFTIFRSGVPATNRSSSPFAKFKRKSGEYPVSIFEVLRKPNYFLEGSGKVKTSLNRIEVEGASPGRVVIKFHWLETLVTSPPLPIREFPIEGSPIGFIEVENGETNDFVIYNGY